MSNTGTKSSGSPPVSTRFRLRMARRRNRVDYLNESCNCPDAEHRPSRTCKHVYCVGIHLAKRRARSFTCDGCRMHTPNRDGYEVGEDNLTFFPGQRLCKACALAHGVL